MLKQYKKYIVESRSIIYISTILVFLIRWMSLNTMDNKVSDVYDDSFLWGYISPLFSNIYVSCGTAFVVSIGLALYALYLNDKYALIRVRTTLPYVFFIFITACFPLLSKMNPAYIGVFFVLLAIDILYDSYQKEIIAEQSFRMAFLLAFGSLFSFSLLLYVPLFWIGTAIVRSFKFKAILASLLGVAMVYWITGFVIYFMELPNPFVLYLDKWKNYSFPSLFYEDLDKWIFFGVNTLTALIIIIYYYANSYKDKIQVRTYIAFLNVLFFFSLLISVGLLFNPDVNFLTMLMASSFIFAHYFALIQQKGSVYFFIAVILFYLMLFSYKFGNLV